MMPNGFKIYTFAILTGLRSILKEKVLIGLKRLLLPITYWRYSVFSFMLDQFVDEFKNNKKNMKILDIGSPKLLALFLAVKYNTAIYTTDLQDKAIWNMWQTYFDCWNRISTKEEYITEYQDGK
ncbi:MAG: hypothetical protein ACFFDN_09760 [Candidatus Hodarchaeota archaeon]